MDNPATQSALKSIGLTNVMSAISVILRIHTKGKAWKSLWYTTEIIRVFLRYTERRNAFTTKFDTIGLQAVLFRILITLLMDPDAHLNVDGKVCSRQANQD
eukprot:scaffold78719_cov13-Prasinocladus_malaysianus.AAC.1